MTTMPKSETHDGLKIINAGLFRTATKSMARAYQILGFKAHHGLLQDVLLSPWTGIEQAAEATWPAVRSWGSPERPPFQRSDWDALWGDECKLWKWLCVERRLRLRCYAQTQSLESHVPFCIVNHQVLESNY
jgi:hypothetical protein